MGAEILRKMPAPITFVRTGATLGALASLLTLSACERDEHLRFSGDRLDLRMREYRILPQQPSIAPGRITIRVRNDGVQAHRLAIGEGRNAIRQTPLIAPGHSARLEITLPEGSYRLFCSLSNHDTLGMTADLDVS
jgi:hypothetical protein